MKKSIFFWEQEFEKMANTLQGDLFNGFVDFAEDSLRFCPNQHFVIKVALFRGKTWA